MGRYIEIGSGPLTAKITPSYGGMLAQLALGGTEVLWLNEDEFDFAPMVSGGAPVMFPFVSRTKNDTYTLDGREYQMPMHGFLKNAAFAVKSVAPNAVTLWSDASTSQKAANYPFDYMLEIEYRTAPNALVTTARLTNLSDRPMPHYLGWHTFFKATDKAALRFEHSMAYRYNYVDCVDEPSVEDIRFTEHWDDVFHTPLKREFTLYNKPDGYRARYLLDEAHNAMIVATEMGDKVCLAPWCGLPDSINNGRFVKYVQPGQTESYVTTLEVEKL